MVNYVDYEEKSCLNCRYVDYIKLKDNSKNPPEEWECVFHYDEVAFNNITPEEEDLIYNLLTRKERSFTWAKLVASKCLSYED